LKLLIDIGNSRTKYVIESHEQLSEIHTMENHQLTEYWFSQTCQGVNEVIAANVSQASLTKSLAMWAKNRAVRFLSVTSEVSAFGIETAYQQASQLGVDRWLALIGASVLYPKKNILIIDAGTATTIDLLHNDGQHLGGWILPGVDTMFNSLLQNTVHVSATQTSHENLPNLTFGKNTSECVNNACWAATVACIKQGLIEAEKYGDLDMTLLIGGNAVTINALLDDKCQHNEKLIFIGLQRYSVN
jgi:type III pantothenate kinase